MIKLFLRKIEENKYKNRGFNSLAEQFANVSNKDYWIKKIKRNIERDKITSDKLRKEGWLVIRIWESQIKQDINKCIKDTLLLVNRRKNDYENNQIH